MSTKELTALQIVREVNAGRLTQKEAAERLDVVDRTIRRWQVAVREKGATGLVHGNRGKASPRKISGKERDRIVALLKTKYPDFTPILASEKLSELHDIERHRTSIRTIMVEEGIWVPRSKRISPLAIHRAWRERKAHRGELVQFDGSYHPWFEDRLLDKEGRPFELCLLLAVDDATGEILWLQFAPHEGTLPVMRFWMEYAGLHGLPKSVYLDRFSTYKMTQKTAVENPDLKTQLERAMKTLGVEPIFALSPQAKGRVERLFKTLQDRLVKELRLRTIRSVQKANRFLATSFISSFNRKYRVDPREVADFHRQLSRRELQELPETLCRLEKRVVMNDFTVSFKTRWHQLLPTRGLAMRPKDDVLVREYPDETVSFTVRNKRANTIPIDKRPVAVRPSVRRPTPTLIPA